MGEIEFLQHIGRSPCVLRKRQEVRSPCLQYLETQRTVSQGIGGVFLSVCIRFESCLVADYSEYARHFILHLILTVSNVIEEQIVVWGIVTG